MSSKSAVEQITSAIIPFSYESKEVRTIKDEFGNPWWVAKDICDILGIVDNRTATAYLDDDEKGAQKVRTPGGMQEMITINESGLYTLIVRSNKPEAKKFRKWVTSEVLPQIRKTGAYSQNAECGKYPAGGFRDFVSVPSGMKCCADCRQIFPSSKNFFYSNASKEDGLDNYCIPCKKIYRAKMRAATRLQISQPDPIDEAALAIRITAEIMKRLPAIAQPAPVDTQPSWKQLWPMLEQSTDTLCVAVEQLQKDVNAMIPGGVKNVPAGSDPMTYIRLHYSEMEKAARQLCILSELLMWRSPKTLNFHAALGDPRY